MTFRQWTDMLDEDRRGDGVYDLAQERRDRRRERADETATVHVLYDAERTGNVFAFPADAPSVDEQRRLHLRLLDLDDSPERFLPRRMPRRTPPDRAA